MKRLIIIFLPLLFIACENKSEPFKVKNNVLKEYVKVPLDKAKSMKGDIEDKQDKAKDYLDSVNQ